MHHGVFFACEDFWRKVRDFNPCLRFFFFFFKAEISSRTPNLPFFRPVPVRSSSASWDDYGQMFPDELRVSSFPDSFPHHAWTAWSAHSDFVGSRMSAFWYNLESAFLAEWPGSFTCYCGETGMERTPNKSQHTKLTLEKKFSRRSCRDSNWQPFDHKSGALTNKLSRLFSQWRTREK